jgi:hypothetical protein
MDRVVIQPEAAPAERPAEPQAEPQGVDKALADTKAELTRVQQELAELRKAQGQPAAADPAPAADPAKAEEPKLVEPPKIEEPTAEQVQQIAEAIDPTPYEEELSTTGDISPENRAALAEKLKPILGERAAAIVNSHIDGLKATSAALYTDFYSRAGGAEQYGEMVKWAATAYSEADRKAFNEAKDSGDPGKMFQAVESLRSRYESVNGRRGKTIVPTTTAPAAGADVFRSNAELTKAMADPRYRKDPAYRADVAAKLARSGSL